MEDFAKYLVPLLQYLLPGFVAAWVFYGLTPFVRPSQFERIVQALIFTSLVQIPLILVKKIVLAIDPHWVTFVVLVASFLFGLLLGLGLSFFANNDKIHKKLRNWLITKESSYPSEWFGTFRNNITYIVLHLEGERRLYGWPIQWPSESHKGHFVLEQACWLDEENKEIALCGVELIMIDARDVHFIEFMEKTWEKNHG